MLELIWGLVMVIFWFCMLLLGIVALCSLPFVAYYLGMGLLYGSALALPFMAEQMKRLVVGSRRWIRRRVAQRSWKRRSINAWRSVDRTLNQAEEAMERVMEQDSRDWRSW